MAQFLSGPALGAEIRSILKEQDSRAAVAFWGRGSEDWVTGQGTRVVANLRMGGTNPYAFRKVQADKRQCDALHAKVYLGAEKAVVCSANASINGLSLEGHEQSGWVEAGVLFEVNTEIDAWFESIWSNESRAISGEDWSKAEELWLLRAPAKPTLANFGAFDPTAEKLPLIVWANNRESWTADVDAVEGQAGITGAAAKRRVDDGIWISSPADEQNLRDRWVLIWEKTANGELSKRGSPSFIQMSSIVVKGGFWWDADGQPQDVMLSAEKPSPLPFDPSEKRFKEAFSQTIVEAEYHALLDGDDASQGWYEPREQLMRKFWSTMHMRYSNRLC